jgi:hypothetical protein
MTIQTNPQKFNRSLPIHKVMDINRSAKIVTLSGTDGTSYEVPLDLWGPWEEAQPLVGSEVQLLDR